jgi:hypothetical protein
MTIHICFYLPSENSTMLIPAMLVLVIGQTGLFLAAMKVIYFLDRGMCGELE